MKCRPTPKNTKVSQSRTNIPLRYKIFSPKELSICIHLQTSISLQQEYNAAQKLPEM